MEPIAFRIPEEDYGTLEAYADENDVSLSVAAREHLSKGLEYDDLQAENERLHNEKGVAIEKYQGDLEDEVDDYREYVRKQIEKENASWLTRQKWRIFGRDDDS